MKTMVISIRNTAGVRCREVVCFSEGPLWEVRLYTKQMWYIFGFYPLIMATTKDKEHSYITCHAVLVLVVGEEDSPGLGIGTG